MEDLKELESRRAQIDARIKMLQARDRSSKRKRQTRAKIILGEVALNLAQREFEIFTALAIEISQIVGDRDRDIVFDLLKGPT